MTFCGFLLYAANLNQTNTGGENKNGEYRDRKVEREEEDETSNEYQFQTSKSNHKK